MPLFDGPRQHDDLAGAARRQRKPPLRRAHAGQRAQRCAKPPHLDPQPRAMRVIGMLRAECPRDEHVARHVVGPRFAERACEREQHRTPRQRDGRVGVANDMTARIDDERPGRLQSLDLLEQEETLLAAGDPARRRRAQHEGCAFHLRRQRRDAGVTRGALGPRERRARRLRLQASHRDARNDELVDGSRCGRQRRGVELGERPLRLVDAPDQDEAPDREVARMRGVDPVAISFERRPRRIERLRRPGKVARGEGDLGLGDDTARAGHGLSRAEGVRRASHESFRANEIAELRHARCRAARGQGRRRAGRPGSAPRGDPPRRAPAPRP